MKEEGWISVNDTLPGESGLYLVQTKHAYGNSDGVFYNLIMVNYSYRHKKFNAFDDDKDPENAFDHVIAWRYIEPYKERENDI